MLYISTKFCEIILNGIKVMEKITLSILKITKGNKSAKNVGRVAIVYICTLFGHALNLYQVL